jgi:hypothetical protein
VSILPHEGPCLPVHCKDITVEPSPHMKLLPPAHRAGFSLALHCDADNARTATIHCVHRPVLQLVSGLCAAIQSTHLLPQVTLVQMRGSVYLNCCSTPRTIVLHSRQRKAPRYSSGRTWEENHVTHTTCICTTPGAVPMLLLCAVNTPAGHNHVGISCETSARCPEPRKGGCFNRAVHP